MDPKVHGIVADKEVENPIRNIFQEGPAHSICGGMVEVRVLDESRKKLRHSIVESGLRGEKRRRRK